MRERIARHQRDRAERVPGLQTLEEPATWPPQPWPSTAPRTRWWWWTALTLWLTNWLMPAGDEALDLKQNRLWRLTGKRKQLTFE